MTEQLYEPDLGDAPEISFDERKSDEQNWNEYAVVLAEKLGLPIRFVYIKSEWHDPAPRRLEDVQTKVTVDGKLMVVGTDPDRHATRSFRVDRITNFIQIDRY